MLSSNKIVRASSTEEYVDMVKQAIDETFDLRQAIEFSPHPIPPPRRGGQDVGGSLPHKYVYLLY